LEDIIKITVTDRDDGEHHLEAPTDMNLNLMEVLKSYELPVEGTCGGMALCASCHCYVESDHELREASDDEEDMLENQCFARWAEGQVSTCGLIPLSYLYLVHDYFNATVPEKNGNPIMPISPVGIINETVRKFCFFLEKILTPGVINVVLFESIIVT